MNKWKDGDAGWEVEWCTDVPILEEDLRTAKMDGASFKRRWFKYRDDAIKFAQEIAHENVLDSVRVGLFMLQKEYGEIEVVYSIFDVCYIEKDGSIVAR
jgi:hypothetical protein